MSGVEITQADEELGVKFWRVHPDEIIAAGLTRPDWYTREIARHRQSATAPLIGWREAVDDALATLFRTANEFETPRDAVRWLIEQEQRMALDPAISADARSLQQDATAPLIAALEEAQEALEPFARAQHIVGTVEKDGRIRCILTYQPDADETFTLGSLDTAHKALTRITAELAKHKGNGDA